MKTFLLILVFAATASAQDLKLGYGRDHERTPHVVLCKLPLEKSGERKVLRPARKTRPLDTGCKIER